MPLSGVRVVELAQIIAGPVVGQVLAELGADVIKVERPEGDESRRWTPPVWFGAAPTFHGVNRSKRSVSLDLTTEDGRAGLLKLVRGADVFVQNLRPGVTEKLGLGPVDLLRENPRLVYCDMGAFGHKGPKRLDPGFEVLFQAFSGLMDNTGDPDGQPMRMGAAVCDMSTGLWTALGALAGLRQRETTGKGVVVNTSLLETAMFLLTTQFVSHKATGKRPVRHPTGSPRVVVFEAFDAADGRILITAATDRLFKRLGLALGRSDWAESPAFEGNAARMERHGEIVRDLQAVLAAGRVREWMEVFEAAGVPASPINNLAEALEEPQVRALDMVVDVPERDGMQALALPISFDGRRPAIRAPAPGLGADNPIMELDDPWSGA